MATRVGEGNTRRVGGGHGLSSHGHPAPHLVLSTTQTETLWPALASHVPRSSKPLGRRQAGFRDTSLAQHTPPARTAGPSSGDSNLCCVTNTRRTRQTQARAQPWPRTRTLVLQLLHFNMDGPGSYASLGCQVPLPRSVAPSPPARNPVASPPPFTHAAARTCTRAHTHTHEHIHTHNPPRVKPGSQ